MGKKKDDTNVDYTELLFVTDSDTLSGQYN